MHYPRHKKGVKANYRQSNKDVKRSNKETEIADAINGTITLI